MKWGRGSFDGGRGQLGRADDWGDHASGFALVLLERICRSDLDQSAFQEIRAQPFGAGDLGRVQVNALVERVIEQAWK